MLTAWYTHCLQFLQLSFCFLCLNVFLTDGLGFFKKYFSKCFLLTLRCCKSRERTAWLFAILLDQNTTLVPRSSHFFCRNLCLIFFVSLSSKLNTSIGNILKLLTFDSLLTTENVFSFSNDEFNDLFPKVNSQFHGSLDCSD